MLDLQQQARQIFLQTIAAIDIPRVMQRKLQLRGSVLHCAEPVYNLGRCTEDRTATSANGLAAHDTTNNLVSAPSEIDLRDFERIQIIAFGKAAHGMVAGLHELLAPEFHFDGIVSAPVPPQIPVSEMQYFVAGHPLPTAASLEAGRAILDLLRRCDERTLVFFLISGGGSALVESPIDPRFTLEDMQGLNRILVTCGASIDEINTVRKHISAVKGGRLALAAPQAMKITYAVTDVPVGKESALASGPTIPDPTTCGEMDRVISKFGLRNKLPSRIRDFLAKALVPETPKPGDPAFTRAQFHILLGMHDLFHAAHHATEAAGFITICDNSTDDWPLARATDYLLNELAQLQRGNPGRRVAVIADGEVSSPVTGSGIGGRNSAFVLDCVRKISGEKIAVLSAGTDGVDGISPAAGAVASGESLSRAKAAGLDPADFSHRSDSHTFFERLGGAIVTGPTGNNLRDLRILLADARDQ